MSYLFKLPIPYWSADDYAYLINNNLGWISWNEDYYIFDSLDNMLKFKEYLEQFGIKAEIEIEKRDT